MRNQEALDYAAKVAKILLKGSRDVGRTRIRDQSLMGFLSMHLAASILEASIDDSINSFDPTIHEILLFGSTARGEEPHDVDLMVFDKGFYSNVLTFEPGDEGSDRSDWYLHLRGNLEAVLCGWMDMNPATMRETLNSLPVDLHVLPLALFSDKEVRRRLAAKHKDPCFFENAFSRIMRFDAKLGAFVDTDISQLVEQYSRTASMTER